LAQLHLSLQHQFAMQHQFGMLTWTGVYISLYIYVLFECE